MSGIDSVADPEELEHEHEAIQTRLDSAATEMGLENEQFMEEFKGDYGEEQNNSEGMHSEDVPSRPG